jgi:hypothetical protein
LKHHQLASDSDHEIVFLGSSVTEAAVDPELLSRDAYNAALPFSSPISNLVWYRTHFVPGEGDVVVMGVPIWPSTSTRSNDALALGLASAQAAEEGVASALVENRGFLSDWYQRSLERSAMDSGLWTDRGHQTTYYARRDESIAARFDPYGQPRMSTDSEQAVLALAQDVEEAGATFVLMVEPGRFPGQVAEHDVEGYLDYLQRLASESGVLFWDTYSVGWDDSLYADEAHFNHKGTLAFTKYMDELLTEIGRT